MQGDGTVVGCIFWMYPTRWKSFNHWGELQMDPCSSASCLVASSGWTMSFPIVSNTNSCFFFRGCSSRPRTLFKKGPIAKTQQMWFRMLQHPVVAHSQHNSSDKHMNMHRTMHGCIMSKVSSTLAIALQKYFSKAVQKKLKDQTEEASTWLWYCWCL